MFDRFYLDDNLKVMRNFPDSSIDLVCTDPPFFSQNDYLEFDDRWSSLEEYISFIKQRCLEIYRLLKDTGCFYLHCDPIASHYLKVMLDDIFGYRQFLNEIIWSYRRWPSATRHFQRMHNTILFYAKSKNYIWNPLMEPIPLDRKKYKKHAKRDPKTGKINVFFDKTVPVFDSYMRDVWELSFLAGSAKERVGYPTQKPVILYERMIEASSLKNSIVLDPFCGSGTTCVAAAQLGRRYIGIDQNKKAIELAKNRLKNIQQTLL